MPDNERYNPIPLAANAVVTFPQGSPTGIGIFLCTVSGTLTITRADAVVLLNALPVTAGQCYFLNFYMGQMATITLTGGAAGTIGVQ